MLIKNLKEEYQQQCGLEMALEKTEYLAVGAKSEDLNLDGEYIKNANNLNI